MKILHGAMLILLTAFLFSAVPGIPEKIKKADLSVLWYNNHTHNSETGLDNYMFHEPLGFIGNQYERFYIHYSSIQKSKTNAIQYQVQGKSRVRSTICPFTGTITITKVQEMKLEDGSDYPVNKLYKLICQIDFNESRTHAHTGTFKGTMTSYCYFDQNGIPQLASESFGDGENFNQTKTFWSSYTKKLKKKCHWGIYRIPDCGDLDAGAGEFSVNDKYLKNGWASYREALRIANENPQDPAVKEFNRRWWD